MNPKITSSNKKEKTHCRFKKNGFQYIDYKESEFLYRFLNPQGKILPRRYTKNSAKWNRLVSQAIKRARHMALLPYVTDNLEKKAFKPNNKQENIS